MAAARQTTKNDGLSHSPTIRLLAGLVITLSAVAIYAGFTIVQLRSLEDLQARTIDRIFALAGGGHESDARVQVRLSLEARQQAMATAVARLLVENNEIEQAAVLRTQEIYERAKRNVYLFLAAMLVVIALTSLYLV